MNPGASLGPGSTPRCSQNTSAVHCAFCYLLPWISNPHAHLSLSIISFLWVWKTPAFNGNSKDVACHPWCMMIFMGGFIIISASAAKFLSISEIIQFTSSNLLISIPLISNHINLTSFMIIYGGGPDSCISCITSAPPCNTWLLPYDF